MHRIQISQDIRPLSEFRANVASFIQQVQKTNRPLIITHHGKGKAVLMNVDEYEAMIDKIELLQDIHEAEKQLDQGKGIPHRAARALALKAIEK